MSSNYTPDLKRLLNLAGCVFVRYGKGDHEIWLSPFTQQKPKLVRELQPLLESFGSEYIIFADVQTGSLPMLPNSIQI